MDWNEIMFKEYSALWKFSKDLGNIISDVLLDDKHDYDVHN